MSLVASGRCVVLALTLLGPGCGSGSGAGADAGPGEIDAGEESAACQPQSGSRLRLVIREHDDGSSEVVELHDVERDEVCAYRLAADGRLRCLPKPVWTIRYLDEGCTEPVAVLVLGGPGPAPSSVRSYMDVASCGERWRHEVHKLGALLELTAGTALYRLGAGGCVASASSREEDRHAEVVRPIAPDELAAGLEGWGGGRIMMRHIASDDGSRWCDTATLLDRDLDDQPCEVAVGEDGAIRCLPRPAQLRHGFSDPDCTSEVTVVHEESCAEEPPRFAGEYVPDAECTARRRFRTVGAEVTEPLYRSYGEMCEVWEPFQSWVVLQAGPAVSPTSFAELPFTYLPGGSRLERAVRSDGRGLILDRRLFRDTTLDIQCGFRAAADGRDRCLPATGLTSGQATAGSYFADADCTIPAAAGLTWSGCSEIEPSYAVQAGPEGASVFEVTGPWAGGPLFRQSGTLCYELSGANETYWALGEEVPGAFFVAGQSATE
jgi:hypothetical protein